MFSFQNGIIKLTQGDDIDLWITLYDSDGNLFDCSSDPTVRLTVKEKISGDVILEADAYGYPDDSKYHFDIYGEDTKVFTGTKYVYDIELIVPGKVVNSVRHYHHYTLFGPTDAMNYNMIVYPEVGTDEY